MIAWLGSWAAESRLQAGIARFVLANLSGVGAFSTLCVPAKTKEMACTVTAIKKTRRLASTA